MRSLLRDGKKPALARLRGFTALPLFASSSGIPPMSKPSDICIEAIENSYEDLVYGTPIKFGGVALDRVTVLNVKSRVRTVAGKTAAGFGSMPLSNVWAFPSKTMKYDQTLAAMKTLTEKIAKLTADF